MQADRKRRRRTPIRSTVTGLILIPALAFAAGCASSGSEWRDGDSGESSRGDSQAIAKITHPTADATNVPASAEITYSVEQATDSTFELTDAAGTAVKGALRPASGNGQADASSVWLPAAPLRYGTQYTAKLTATDADGKAATVTSTFTTMAKPANLVRVSSFLGDDQVVGVAMPLIVQFSRAVAQDKRADVQRRLFVTSKPLQEGVWHWVSATEIRYRPKAYWKSGTKISYRLATGGLPMGDDWYGRADINVRLSIGPSVVLTVDNASKMMTVVKNGKLLRKVPVSLGKAKTPSSSGTMVIIEKQRKTVFDTFAELGPEEGYRTDIEYAQRLTWGGEYIHAAPWSENVQGQTNVSHGCVNISMANARWLWKITQVGDPVVVKGTERRLRSGNGWTDWNLTWSEYVQGSALPYVSPTASPSSSDATRTSTPAAAAAPAAAPAATSTAD